MRECKRERERELQSKIQLVNVTVSNSKPPTQLRFHSNDYIPPVQLLWFGGSGDTLTTHESPLDRSSSKRWRRNTRSLRSLRWRGVIPVGGETLESNWTGDSGNNTMFLKSKYSLWCPEPRPHSSAPTHVEAQREPIRLQQRLCLVHVFIV